MVRRGTRRSTSGAVSLPTTARRFDTEVTLRAASLTPLVTWGTNPARSSPCRDRSRSGLVRGRLGSRRRREGTRVHGAHGGHRDARGRGRHRVHRLVHELADRGPSRRRARAGRPDGARGRPRAVRARIAPRQVPGRGRGPGRGLRGGGLRVARAGMLDVPRDESRPPRAWPAMRLDLEPQLRGPTGAGGRTHLVSPAVAAATAIAGRFATPGDLE